MKIKSVKMLSAAVLACVTAMVAIEAVNVEAVSYTNEYIVQNLDEDWRNFGENPEELVHSYNVPYTFKCGYETYDGITYSIDEVRDGRVIVYAKATKDYTPSQLDGDDINFVTVRYNSDYCDLVFDSSAFDTGKFYTEEGYFYGWTETKIMCKHASWGLAKGDVFSFAVIPNSNRPYKFNVFDSTFAEVPTPDFEAGSGYYSGLTYDEWMSCDIDDKDIGEIKNNPYRKTDFIYDKYEDLSDYKYFYDNGFQGNVINTEPVYTTPVPVETTATECDTTVAETTATECITTVTETTSTAVTTEKAYETTVETTSEVVDTTETEEEYSVFDINRDGKVNWDDVRALIMYVVYYGDSE